MTRNEHLAWAKQRAIEYLDAGDIANGITSMMSDMDKHPDLGMPSILAQLGMMAMISNNKADARRWVEGFN